MHLGHVELFVEDPERALAFYTDVLGFEVEVVQASGIAWLKLGSTVFVLRPGKKPPHGADYQHAATGFVLYTDDLDIARKFLEGRGLEFKGTDGSPRCLTFTDPDGNWFQLVDPKEQ